MNFHVEENFSVDELGESINIREKLELYLGQWKWFIVSAAMFLGVSFYKVWNESPQYYASAKIMIKQDKDGSVSDNEFTGLDGLGVYGSDRKSLENEIHILTSRRLITKVVKELNLNIQYFKESKPYDLEQYPDVPFDIELLSEKNSDLVENSYFDFEPIYEVSTSFKVLVRSGKEFDIIDANENSLGRRNFGEDFTTPFGKIRINLSQELDLSFVGEVIKVFITPLNTVVDSYRNILVIEPIDEDSNVLLISLNGHIPEKSILIINNLIQQYNADANEDKIQVYVNTTNFLNERIELLTTQLIAIEVSAEQFKSTKGLVDVQSESGVFLQSSSDNERTLMEENTQLQLIDYIIKDINTSEGLIPTNLGINDGSIEDLTAVYNNLILKRNRILKSSSSINPIILGLDSEIVGLKNSLLVSLENLKNSIKIKISRLADQRVSISSRIASVPKNEREYKDIIRMKETKNSLYLFLLQKLEESEISKSVTVDNARIIDAAYTNGAIISPKPLRIYLSYFIAGLFIPFVIIFVKDLLDTKVHNENDLKKLGIPYLGDIPLVSGTRKLYITDGDDSNIAEAFRYVRTNVNFMLDSKDKGKIIFISSTQSHEGKTFCAINLSISLAISGKKTLLIAMDLRAPKISDYLDLDDGIGVTNFIKNNELELEDILDRNIGINNLNIIHSGSIPPNPVELLMSSRVNDIFDEVKDIYEYIIVDTAPVGLVTDTIQISKYADMTIYVVKANFLDKRLLHIPFKLNRERKLPNMAFLLNGFDQLNSSYGYGYGYGKKEKKNWFRKVFG